MTRYLRVMVFGTGLACSSLFAGAGTASAATTDEEHTVKLSVHGAPEFPTVMRLRPVPNSFTSGPNGDLYMDSPSPFSTVGVLMQAHSGTPNITAKLGTSDTASYFAINNSTSEVVRIRGDGRVGIGTSSPSYPLAIGQSISGGSLSSGGNWNITMNDAVGGESIGYQSTTNHAVFGSTVSNADILFAGWTGATNTERMRITSAGNVGIGTQAPQATLHVNGTSLIDNGTIGSLTIGGSTPAAESALVLLRAGSAKYGWLVGAQFNLHNSLEFTPSTAVGGNTFTTPVMVIQQSGNVGVGTSNPSYRLDVNGATRVTGDIIATGSITGVRVLGAVYQDVAEWVPSAESLSPGTVVVLSRDRSNEVTTSRQPYDTRVAGVVSAQPGILLGQEGEQKAKIATTGRVRVRVDATRHPIDIGDLLVSSDRPGTAMRSEPITIGGRSFHQPGTIIGKALEPLSKGQGEILVLLTLQ